MTATTPTTRIPDRPRPSLFENPTLRRLVAWLFGGFVLCLMVGNQEGSQNDFGVSFHKATATLRLLTFLLVGFVGFLVMTFWPLIRPYIRHPGAVTVFVGVILSGAGMTLTKWYDPVGKFKAVSKAVSHSHGVPALVSFYFSPVAWALLVVGLLLGGVSVATRRPVVGYATLAYGVVFAIIIFVAHAQLVNFANEAPDHTLGVFVTCLGYLVIGGGGLVAARSDAEFGDPRAALDRAMAWRPGFPLAGIGIVLGLMAFFDSAWFAPLRLNAGYHKASTDFHGYGLASIAVTYLGWLGITLFLVGSVAALAACLFRIAILGWVTAAIGFVGVVLTFITLDKLTTTGTHAAPEYGKFWDNLGAGGWLACLAFSLLLAAGALAAIATRAPKASDTPVSSDQVGVAADGKRGVSINSTIIPLSIAFVLFYPPTLPLNWQNVVVVQIAAYLLLAVGLNVVVGWAGLLDLGYIAFFGIGSYTTAYFTSALPLKPPSWLHFTPLVCIPFAIVACLIAGVLLGAPTLRLRGDYLAIVTLGFGEIVQLAAVNNLGNITGGPIGPNVPNPVVHIHEHWTWLPSWLHFDLHITWGLDNLPYWYLLIALLAIVIVLFTRLERSRTGRAWAAIREDEVAAQATGVRTMRFKLLAFAIGASTSGVAGVFSASQIGYFEPQQFSVQASILIVAYVVFGGMGSLQGALAGAAVLTWLPYFLQSQVPLPDSQLWIGAVVILMMIFRPAGLIPAKRRQAELSGFGGPATAEATAVPAGEGL